MDPKYNILITNGVGTDNVLPGSYSVTTNTPGYDDSTLTPTSVNVVDGTTEYEFTVAATGTLTIHVTEDGTSTGTPVVGATFYRTDASGNTYGTPVTTNDQGNAVINNVPFDTTGFNIYYKETASDGRHAYPETVQTVSMTAQTQTVELQNALPPIVTFKLMDANYTNYPVESSTMSLQ